MRTFILLIFLTTIIYTANSKSSRTSSEFSTDEDMQNDNAKDDYYDESTEDSNEKVNKAEAYTPAEILSHGQVFYQLVGKSVQLPCQVPDKIDSVIIWFRNDSIISQASVKMAGTKPNIHVLSNHSLYIDNISADDAATYKCESAITEQNKVSIVHELILGSSPKISQLYAKNNNTALMVSDDLILVCEATGLPKPQISWHRMNNNENERLVTMGDTLTISKITLKDSGQYFCLADNKLEFPATEYINISIMHKPVVSIEKIVVNSDSNMDTELKCTVHAEPEASVIWKKGGINVKPNEHIKLISDNIDHILILKGLEESDFGEYVCFAINRLGKSEKRISLVKTPAVVSYIKPERHTKDVVLTWKVESKTPISEHELQYKKKEENEWKTVKPPVRNGDNDVYTIEYILKDLGEGTYESRVRSQNKHGWSQYTDVTSFEGAHGKQGPPQHHKHNKNHKTTTEPTTGSGASFQLQTSLLCLCLILSIYSRA